MILLMFSIFGFTRFGTAFMAETLQLNSLITIPWETGYLLLIAFIIHRLKGSKIGKRLTGDLTPATEAFGCTIGECLTLRNIKEISRRSNYYPCGITSSADDAMARDMKAETAGDLSSTDLCFGRIVATREMLEADIKIIHIIRYIRGIYGISQANREGQQDVCQWLTRLRSTSNMYLRKAYRSRPYKYLMIRVEDVISSSESYCRSIIHFLSVHLEDNMRICSEEGSRDNTCSDHADPSMPCLQSCVEA